MTGLLFDRRRSKGPWRRLTLSHDGEPFLQRWGVVTRWGGFYVHHIAGPDPGMDLHDHPWAFVSIVLRGGYSHETASTEAAVTCAKAAEQWPDTCTPGAPSHRQTGSVTRMGMRVAHRITRVEPNTWTLVLRGPDRRIWGFYPPSGRVVWTAYDYQTRRPSRADFGHMVLNLE